MSVKNKSKYKYKDKLTIYGKLDVLTIKKLMEITGSKNKNGIVNVLVDMVMYQNKELVFTDNMAYAARNGKAILTKDKIHLSVEQWEYCKNNKILPWITYYDTIVSLMLKQ